MQAKENESVDPRARKARILIEIKSLHTAVWALLVGCILAIPVAGMTGRFRAAGILSAIVLLECLVLAMNRGRCPLTNLAERFTEERAANFDIYLPLWLARHNKTIFGGLYVAGMAIAAVCWGLSLR